MFIDQNFKTSGNLSSLPSTPTPPHQTKVLRISEISDVSFFEWTVFQRSYYDNTRGVQLLSENLKMKLYAWFNTHACLKINGIFLKSLITYLIQVVFYSAHSMKSRRWQISINQAMLFIGSKDSPPFHNFGLIDNPKSYRRHMALKKSAIIELQNHSSRVHSRATRNVRSRKYWQRQSRFLIHHWPKC